MARTEALTREEVCSAIQAWGSGVSSDDELRMWVVNNYFPVHQQVAPGEPDRAAIAIGLVLTEFECAWPPYPFGRDVAGFALALVRSSDTDFEARKSEFYKSLGGSNDAL